MPFTTPRRPSSSLGLLLLSAIAAALVASCSKVEEVKSDFYALESYIYGFPLVLMDVTRAVTTATPTSGEYKAPLNQFARIRTVVSPDFKDVVRISVNSLWSFGFVDLENFYVRNALDRYGLLSAMPLKFNADGSLDVYVEADSPGKDKQSNWVPTPPSRPFNLTARIYQPKKAILDGTYKMPPVRRVE